VPMKAFLGSGVSRPLLITGLDSAAELNGGRSHGFSWPAVSHISRSTHCLQVILPVRLVRAPPPQITSRASRVLSLLSRSYFFASSRICGVAGFLSNSAGRRRRS